VARRLPSPPVVPTEGRVAPGVPGATTRTDPTDDPCRGERMIHAHSIDALAQRLSALVPPGLREAREDLTATFRSVLQAGLRELDLVTREEFDVQRCVLLRTREKIEELEQQLLALERAVGADTPKP
jgi:ubiquinone biosynthesis accessory factor UbiK